MRLLAARGCLEIPLFSWGLPVWQRSKRVPIAAPYSGLRSSRQSNSLHFRLPTSCFHRAAACALATPASAPRNRLAATVQCGAPAMEG